jgi:hypothetical protein
LPKREYFSYFPFAGFYMSAYLSMNQETNVSIIFYKRTYPQCDAIKKKIEYNAYEQLPCERIANGKPQTATRVVRN